MKRRLFVLGATIVLCVLLLGSWSTTFAAADAVCTADPPAGPVGTVFVLSCEGYTPGAFVYAYLVEPSGAAGQLFFESGAIKVNEQGVITYTQPSRFEDESIEGDIALQTGTWIFVAEELGLAKSVLHRGEVKFTVTGGTEGVSGASLHADPELLYKPEPAYVHFRSADVTVTRLNASQPVEFHGSGFAPGEVVSIWLEPPGGGCPSFTEHTHGSVGQIIPGSGSVVGDITLNTPAYDGIGAQAFGNARASAQGEIEFEAFFFSTACEGAWHFVARGNASGSGGDTYVTVVGNAVETSAWLAADPPVATALFDHIRFSGYGFGANEHVSCWLTSPQGRTLGFPDDLEVTFNHPEDFQRNVAIRSDASGSVQFDMVTGSLYDREVIRFALDGDRAIETEVILDPIASEGALGEYAMSCRGDSSGATAIARFVLTGGLVDP